jgi:curved DNA-binding protein CbpA
MSVFYRERGFEMNAPKDYYFILGIVKTASQFDIERAYQYSMGVVKTSDFGTHSAGDSLQGTIMGDINEAYECLRNPVTRRMYDAQMEVLSPPPPRPEKFNPAVGINTKETLEYCFVAMKKKKSRSLPSLGKFFSAMLFMVSVGFSAYNGLTYFQTGHFGFSAKSLTMQATSTQNSNNGMWVSRGMGRGEQPAPPPPPTPVQTAPRPATNNGGGKGRYERAYDIRYGGVITASKAVCRKEPSAKSASTANMAKNAVIFVTKESRDDDGALWYFVESDRGSGWVLGGELKVFK